MSELQKPDPFDIPLDVAADPVVFKQYVQPRTSFQAQIGAKRDLEEIRKALPEGRHIVRLTLAPEWNRIEGMGEPAWRWRLAAMLDNGDLLGETPMEDW